MNNRYTITEAANMLRVHAHTLRYWEEELDLTIPRNELGHRVYYDEQIEMFRSIKELKEEGYQLQAIRTQVGAEVPDYDEKTSKMEESAASKEDKMQKFQEIINLAVRQAIQENRDLLGQEITRQVVGEMNVLAQDAKLRQDEQYRKLDALIRQKVIKERKSRFLKWGQQDVAKKLKEELKNNKKEAATKQDSIISET